MFGVWLGEVYHLGVQLCSILGGRVSSSLQHQDPVLHFVYYWGAALL